MRDKAMFCVVILALTSGCVLSIDEEKAKTFLLPGDLKPTHYNVHLITHIDKFEAGKNASFDGEVRIFMEVVKNNVTSIVLNMGEIMSIRQTTLYHSVQGWGPVSLGKGSYNARTEKVTFSLPFTVNKGEYLGLNINYTAEHYDPGFICNFYYRKNNTKRWFAYTDMQPAAARLVFPCFDEPKYKATYSVSVSVPRALVLDGYHALSNAAESWREEVGNNTIIHFERTAIPMSTYLFAVFVSDFESTKPRFFNGSNPNAKRGQLKTWAESEFLEDSEECFPQLFASILINIYTQDFDIGYDFGKIDQVIHHYSGAMENWGLIYYGRDSFIEVSLLTFELLAHELSHQWFGNLVTLHWWSDIWLNEGFASYFEYFGVEKINEAGMNGKNWNMSYYFVLNTVQYHAMSNDVPEAYNHPLTVEVYDPYEYSWYFNKFSYGKGAAVIYMWRNIFGEKAFGKVLRHYLRRFQKGVATPEGLLACFDLFANESESDLMDMKPSEIFRNWHVKVGVPIVSVRKIKENPPTYVLSQDVFRLNKATEVEQAEWTIPISYSTSNNYNFNSTKAEIWLTPGKAILELAKPVKWIVLNNMESGYYRVNYNIENWATLFRVLSETKDDIHNINRAQIIDDSMEIARSTAFDYLPYDMVLEMLLYLRNEPNYFPWKSAFNKLEFLKTQLNKNESVYPLFQMFVLDLLSNRIGSSWLAQQECHVGNNDNLEKAVISWTCEMGHPLCSLQSKWLHPQERKKTCADYLDVTYCAYIRSSSDSITWDEVWNDYATAENVKMKMSLLRGVGCTKNKLILTRLLEKSMDDNSQFSRAERTEIVSSVLRGNPENVKTLLNFMEENIHSLKIALSRHYLNWNIFIDIAEKLSTHDEIEQMRKLTMSLGKLTDRKGSPDKILEMAMRIMSANNQWQRIRSKSVSDWLISRYSR